jgi:anti-anti-sigma factor
MAELEEGASHATVELSSINGEPAVIMLTGEVDMSNVVAIEAELGALLSGTPERVVIDVSSLTFIDSSGIAVLIRAAERSTRFALRNPSTIVKRIIQATGLSEVLPVEP